MDPSHTCYVPWIDPHTYIYTSDVYNVTHPLSVTDKHIISIHHAFPLTP